MTEYKIGRQEIIDTLAARLKDVDYMRASWLGGSDASGRTDAWSDIDIQVIVEDDRVEDALEEIHRCLETLSPIAHRFRLPEPTWHGHSQEFLALADADPCHSVDLLVAKLSAEERFLERERHGDPQVLFDKDGLLDPPPMDWGAHIQKMSARLAVMREQFHLWQPFVIRAVRRGHGVDAHHAYLAATLRPLIEILRMRHCPERFDYGPRYLDRDLPDHWETELERLAYPGSIEELGRFQGQAAEHFCAELAAFDRGDWNLPAVPDSG